MAISRLLDKTEYGFLRAALPKSKTDLHYDKLWLYMVTEEGRLFTTDGIVMHSIPALELERGFYTWSAAMDQLVRIDMGVFNNHGFIESSYGSMRKYKVQLEGIEKLKVISFPFSNKNYGFGLDKVSSTQDAPCYFRRGRYYDEDFSVCVGVNAYPIDFDEDGNVSKAEFPENYIALSLKYLKNIEKYMGSNLRMKWNTNDKPAIFESMLGFEAFLMPLRLPKNGKAT